MMLRRILIPHVNSVRKNAVINYLGLPPTGKTGG